VNASDPHPAPVLICFDGSTNAERAIAEGAALLAPRPAIVLTVWEPLTAWEPYDPGAVFSRAVTALGSESLGLDQIARDLAQEKSERGTALAVAAGFAATGRIERGKPWRVICDVAEEIGAGAIVIGARGLSRVQSALLGSVSAAVAVHTRRPLVVIPPRAAGE
jgi:nucleotide-binding universal stress UspA family protein